MEVVGVVEGVVIGRVEGLEGSNGDAGEWGVRGGDVKEVGVKE